jgi:hypothetical protein
MSIERLKRKKESDLAKFRRAIDDNSRYEQLWADHPAVPEHLQKVRIGADQKERTLREGLDKLRADDDLTAEAKLRRAQELHERLAPRIEEGRRQLRESLLKSSKTNERAAIPMPPGVSVGASEPTEMLLAQNERERILRAVERRRSAAGPFKPDVADLLRQEYERGMESDSTTEAAAICRGALAAAQELGLGDGWLAPFMRERHYEAQDKARQLYFLADSVSISAPALPREFERAMRRGQFSQNPTPPLLVPASGPPIPASGGSSRGTKKRRRKGS